MSNNISTFDSTKEPLADILKGIGEGIVQLPDFQRGWVWDDHHIVSLLASIAQAFPIGAVMSLETGNSEVMFKTRPFQGVFKENLKNADRLILDGQQRLTSLFQALYSPHAVHTRDTRGKEMERYYFIDINKTLNDFDLEESIISVPNTRIQLNFRKEIEFDYSTKEKQWEAEVFPLNIIFNVSLWNTWQTGYIQAKGNEKMPEMLNKWNTFFQKILQPVQQYHLPVIELNKETSKAAICHVFEKVNTGGVSLNVFELLTATFAINDFNLRDDWEIRRKRMKEHDILKELPSDNFLQAIALLTSYERRRLKQKENVSSDKLPAVSCKRKDILKLSADDYEKWAEKAEEGFVLAARFLHTQFIFSNRDIPYKTQIVPLGVILTMLGNDLDHEGVRAQIKRWYWSGVLGELYGSATDTRFAKDVPEVLEWIKGNDEPSTVKDASFRADRLYSLRSRNSAAYKGIYALMIQKGALDFRSGENINHITYFEDYIDIHHIFPVHWCYNKGIEPNIYNSIINKTPLSYKTNRKIGGRAPSNYLASLQKETNMSDDRQTEILESHIIEKAYLQADDFGGFYSERKSSIVEIISEAIGKKVEVEESVVANEL